MSDIFVGDISTHLHDPITSSNLNRLTGILDKNLTADGLELEHVVSYQMMSMLLSFEKIIQTIKIDPTTDGMNADNYTAFLIVLSRKFVFRLELQLVAGTPGLQPSIYVDHFN